MKEKVYLIQYGREEWSGWKNDNCDTVRAADVQKAISKFKEMHKGQNTEIRRITIEIIERIEAPEDCFGGMA